MQKTIGRRGRWSIGETALLKDYYARRSDVAIARALGRSVESVQRMAEQIFQDELKTGPWSADEIQILKQCLGVSDLEVIGRRLRRSESDILNKVSSLARKTQKGPWEANEILLLKQLYGSRSDKDLALILGRNESAIRQQAAILCLSKDKGFLRRIEGDNNVRMPRWSPEEEEALARLYNDHSNLEIAKILKRSVKSIVSKAHDLKLKKSKERLEEMGRENVSQRRDR